MTKEHAIKYLENLRKRKCKNDMNIQIDYAIKCINQTSLCISHIIFESRYNYIELRLISYYPYSVYITYRFDNMNIIYNDWSLFRHTNSINLYNFGIHFNIIKRIKLFDFINMEYQNN